MKNPLVEKEAWPSKVEPCLKVNAIIKKSLMCSY